MPLYEYECDACGQRFEIIQKFSDPPPDVCARCGKGPVQRLLSSPAIQFKGSGWYITDYAQKGRSESDGAAGKSDGAEKTGTKGDTKTETKPAAKADAAPAAPPPPSSAAKT
ncbi:MAG: FmdB family zinc ribbon protein [Vicinamibacterales bacterium]